MQVHRRLRAFGLGHGDVGRDQQISRKASVDRLRDDPVDLAGRILDGQITLRAGDLRGHPGEMAEVSIA